MISDNIINILEKNKAENISIYENIRNGGITYVVASCLSNRHTKSLAEYIIQEIKHNCSYIVEGMEDGNWILINLDDGTFVHIFKDVVRDYYEVDKLWKSFVNRECFIDEDDFI